VKNTTQKEPHSTPRTEQNESNARDEAHMSLRKNVKAKHKREHFNASRENII
jgi:hypothetical protein